MLFDDMVYGLMEESDISTDTEDLDDVDVEEAALDDPFLYMEGAYYQNIINFNNINTAMLAESYQCLREGKDGDDNIVSRAFSKIKEAIEWAIEKVKQFWAAVKSKFKQFYQKILNFLATVGKGKMPDNYQVEIEWFENVNYDTIIKSYIEVVNNTAKDTMSLAKGEKLTFTKDTEKNNKEFLDIYGKRKKRIVTAKFARDTMKDYGRMISMTDKTAAAAIKALKTYQKTSGANITPSHVKGATSSILALSSAAAKYIQELCVTCRKAYGVAWKSYKNNEGKTVKEESAYFGSYLDALEF